MPALRPSRAGRLRAPRPRAARESPRPPRPACGCLVLWKIGPLGHAMRSRPLHPSGAALYSRGVSRSPAPSHQSREVLLESLGLAVVDFRCRAHVEPEGPEEPNPTHSIVFVRRGVFRPPCSVRRALVADANHVLYFNAGEPYRYAHPLTGRRRLHDPGPWRPAARSSWSRITRRRTRATPQAPFRRGHALSGPAVSRLHYELLGLLRRRDVDALRAPEDVALRARRRGGRGSPSGGPGTQAALGVVGCGPQEATRPRRGRDSSSSTNASKTHRAWPSWRLSATARPSTCRARSARS